MEARISKTVKEILKDRKARHALRTALTSGKGNTLIMVGDKSYTLSRIEEEEQEKEKSGISRNKIIRRRAR